LRNQVPSGLARPALPLAHTHGAISPPVANAVMAAPAAQNANAANAFTFVVFVIIIFSPQSVLRHFHRRLIKWMYIVLSSKILSSLRNDEKSYVSMTILLI
jgi:hypothetical protein